MSTQETYPAQLFPLRGDISAESGNVTVEVIGIQTIPFSDSPTAAGQVPTYNPVGGTGGTPSLQWVSNAGSAVLINGVAAGDYLISVNTALTINYGSDDFLGVRINGVVDGGE
jgi:hypothetical protein